MHTKVNAIILKLTIRVYHNLSVVDYIFQLFAIVCGMTTIVSHTMINYRILVQYRNFESVSKYLPFNKLDCDEVVKFIAVCENRRERARILMNEIAPVLGFDVIAMTVVATIVPKSNNVGGYELLKEILFAPLYGILLIFLFISFIFLFVMLAHYRVQVHLWTAFEDGAILQKPPTEEQAP